MYPATAYAPVHVCISMQWVNVTTWSHTTDTRASTHVHTEILYSPLPEEEEDRQSCPVYSGAQWHTPELLHVPPFLQDGEHTAWWRRWNEWHLIMTSCWLSNWTYYYVQHKMGRKWLKRGQIILLLCSSGYIKREFTAFFLHRSCWLAHMHAHMSVVHLMDQLHAYVYACLVCVYPSVLAAGPSPCTCIVHRATNTLIRGI